MAKRKSRRKKRRNNQQAKSTLGQSEQGQSENNPIQEDSTPTPVPPKPAKPDSRASTIEAPPTTIGGILVRLGPGLIVAGSIVGSGELIATTATGAQAGFWLLWLILIGCVIKVFVQVELGRYSIVNGQTTMSGLNEVPGPVIDVSLTGGPKSKTLRGNWLVWYWFLMFCASLAQLGGIVGGVGQALAISAPLTEGGKQYNVYAKAETELIVAQSEWGLYRDNKLNGNDREQEQADKKLESLRSDIFERERASNEAVLGLKQQQFDKVRTKLSAIPSGSKLSETQQATKDKLGEAQTKLDSELQSITAANEMLPTDEPEKDIEMLTAYASLVIFYEGKLAAANKVLEKSPKDQRATADVKKIRSHLSFLRPEVEELEEKLDLSMLTALRASRKIEKPPTPTDDKVWATIVTVLTAVVLVMGRYGLIQSFSTAMVALFTLITIVNLFLLQSSPSWGVSVTDIVQGMSFRLPPNSNKALATALATFGIIGVGASELITYPYWCIEKGYARFTGPRDATDAWAERARGWMRVMRWDAWCSMVVYTFATIAFYLLGAAILYRTSLDPKGPEMIRYLSVMYKPVFGGTAQAMFLFGSFAVLYSTFFVANASLARVFSDVLRVLNLARTGDGAHQNRVRILSGLLPFVCLSSYVSGWEPQQLVLISGLMQAMMLPMLASAALYFRYYYNDERLKPGKAWDLLLWTSAAGMLVAGAWAAWAKVIAPMLEM